jgi:hypothetical protein
MEQEKLIGLPVAQRSMGFLLAASLMLSMDGEKLTADGGGSLQHRKTEIKNPALTIAIHQGAPDAEKRSHWRCNAFFGRLHGSPADAGQG